MLEKLAMVGASWRAEGAEALAGFALEEAHLEAALQAFKREHDLAEVVYIATCNRIELMFVHNGAQARPDLRDAVYRLLTGRAAAPGEASRALRAWIGEGAAEHLFMIAAALDSASLGEVEIAGQVRAAHARAQALSLNGPVTDFIFEQANRVAARIRGETELSSGRVSLAEIAVDLISRHCAGSDGSVALVGVSPMTERAAVSLKGSGRPMLFVNRTLAAAEDLATQYGAAAMSLEDFVARPPAVAAVLSATGAEHAVINAATIERLNAAADGDKPPLMVDMAVPPDIDPEACVRFGLQRHGMDDIARIADANRGRRADQAAVAREMIDTALNELNERMVERTFGPLIGMLQKRYQRTAAEGVERLLKKELAGLGEEERDAVRKWSSVLAKRFAHIPTLGLRGLMRNGPEGSLDAFLDGLEPEFSDELRAAIAPREDRA